MTLTGSEGYTGGTTISAGTLQIGDGGSGASIGSTSGVTDNATLVFDHADLVTFSPTISGSGSLVQTGAGNLTLTGSNTYSGSTTISGGSLQIGNGGSGEFLASPSVNVSNGAALVFNHANALTYSGLISGGGSLSQTGAGVLTLTGSNTSCGSATISGGVLQVGNGAALVVAGPTLVNSTGTLLATYGTFTANGDVTVNGGNLLVNGAFSLGGGHTLTVQNNGLTDFAQGPFFLDQGTSAHVASGGTLQNVSQLAVGFSGLGNGAFTVDGSNTVVAAGALLVGGGGASGSATFSGSSTSSFNYMGIAADFFPGTSGTVSITSGASVTLAGALDLADAGGRATGSIVVSGAGSQLTQTSSASVVILGSGAFGAASLTVADGALFSALGPIIVNSPATLNISGGSVIVQGSLAGNVSDDSTLDFAPTQSFDYAGDISGNGGLIKDGPVSLTLSGSDTYTGGTTIDDGTLYVASSAALPSGTCLIVGAGGTFNFDPAEAGRRAKPQAVKCRTAPWRLRFPSQEPSRC